MKRLLMAGALASAACLAACGNPLNTLPADAGSGPVADAGSNPVADAGSNPVADAGTGTSDAGSGSPDAGSPDGGAATFSPGLQYNGSIAFERTSP